MWKKYYAETSNCVKISLVKKRVYGFKYSHIIIFDGSVVNFYWSFYLFVYKFISGYMFKKLYVI